MSHTGWWFDDWLWQHSTSSSNPSEKYWARFCTFWSSVYWSFHFSRVQIQLLSINCVFTDSLNINKPDIYYNWGNEAGDGDIKSEFQFKLYEQFKVKIYLIFSHTLELLLMHSERERAVRGDLNICEWNDRLKRLLRYLCDVNMREKLWCDMEANTSHLDDLTAIARIK